MSTLHVSLPQTMFLHSFELTAAEKKAIEDEAHRARMETTMTFLLPKAKKWMEENADLNERCKEVLLKAVRSPLDFITEEERSCIRRHPCLGCLEFAKDAIKFEELEMITNLLNRELFTDENVSVKVRFREYKVNGYALSPEKFWKMSLF